MFLSEENLPVSQKDLEALRDPKGQKGVQWRMQKLEVGIYDMGFPDFLNKRLTKASRPNLSARGARSNTPDIHNSNHQKRRK